LKLEKGEGNPKEGNLAHDKVWPLLRGKETRFSHSLKEGKKRPERTDSKKKEKANWSGIPGYVGSKAGKRS